MISLISLFVSYILAILVGKKFGHHGFQSGVLLALIAFVQVVIVLIVMFLMQPPAMTAGGR